uniref:Uncharacterized protein n=1 Tax=Hippocampus comes TaxID=109280 RepID=A0A3Q3DV35_HIPCM
MGLFGAAKGRVAHFNSATILSLSLPAYLFILLQCPSAPAILFAELNMCYNSNNKTVKCRAPGGYKSAYVVCPKHEIVYTIKKYIFHMSSLIAFPGH